MKIELKKPAGRGGLRGGQLVCVETEDTRGIRKSYYSVMNWRVLLALRILRVGATRQR